MALIQGIHHVCIKCPDDTAYEKTVAFYRDLLELPVYHDWGTGILLGYGIGRMEIIQDGSVALPQGVLRHIAFDVPDTDACIRVIRSAGYPVTVEPKTIAIGSSPSLPCRIAFCIGPMGEEIEFFEEHPEKSVSR